MLSLANYSRSRHQHHLQFFYHQVVPFLKLESLTTEENAKTICFPSFMTDDSTPIELSWNWKSSGSSYPQVRYSIEPMSISIHPGNVAERVRASLSFISSVARYLPSADRQWFELLARELTYVNCSSSSSNCGLGHDISQFFFAFDLRDDGEAGCETLKAYVIPTIRARLEGCSNLDLVSRAIPRLVPNDSSMRSAYRCLTSYLGSLPLEAQPELELVGFDCVAPVKSRLKVYLRTRMTSFNHVVDVLTLGGTLSIDKKEEFKRSISSLKALWNLVLDLQPETSSSQPLPENSERTGGLLFYFEMCPGSYVLQPKVYIPVRHSGKNDETVAKGFGQFLRSQGKGFRLAVSYEDALQRLWYFFLLNLSTGY